MNKAITTNFILKHLDGINGEPWNINCLSENSSIPPEFVKKYLNQTWSQMELFAKNTSISADFNTSQKRKF